MAPPGGPAAIYGFLFQILRTAEWALNLDLSAPERNADNVTLIAEPHGGDVDIRLPQRRLVQQFKVRDGGTWSLAQIVDSALPDLYRAITTADEDVRYEFITSGRMGEWAGAYAFFRSLITRHPGGEPLEKLDSSKEPFVLRDVRYSERSLFIEMTRILREHAPARDELESLTRSKLWHLLSRFEFKPTGDLNAAQANVRRLLSAYVSDDSILDDKAARLRDVVLHYAAEGNRRFTPEELLRDAGIEGMAFSKLPQARNALRDVTITDMQRLIGYDRALSVRVPHKWNDGSRVCVLSGESGQGKSWTLADLAYDLMEGPELVVFVPATGSLVADLTTAAQRIARDALGHNTSGSFEELATHLKRILPDLRNPWLTICLDDVRTAGEIVDLCVERLEEWGIRIAITASGRLAAHDALRKRKAAISAVQDFSEYELREFLMRHRRSWAAIPPDVRKTMRRPLLAAIFAREATEWTPRTEYELYEACWRQLSTVREQPDHPADVGAMLALAGDFARGGTYPWSLRKLKELKVDDAQQVRLETTGWLRADEHSRVSIWHDRLLNWAVAESIVEDVREIANDASAIATLIKQFWGAESRGDGKRPHLGYVPMDVLWICAARGVLSTKQLAAVIHVMESSHYADKRELYDVLGTAGPVVVPALAQRVRDSLAEQDPPGIELVAGDAIVRALRMDEQHATPLMIGLLQDDAEAVQDIGIRAARALPASALAPILWKMLQKHDAHTSPPDAHWQSEHLETLKRDRLNKALTASGAQASEWLREQIESLHGISRQAVTLAWVLSYAATAERRALWLDLKHSLFRKTPPEKPSGLIACIRNFSDRDEVPRLESWASMKSDFAAPSAIGAMAVVAPDKALEFLRNNDLSQVSGFASWWLPWLLLSRPDETLAAARDRLQDQGFVPEWFERSEYLLDQPTIDSLIQHLASQLRRFLQSKDVSARCLSGVAGVLRNAGHAAGIDRLRAQQGTPLEADLVAAIARLPLEEGRFGPEPSEDLRVILRRVSTTAAADALAAALDTHDPSVTEIDFCVAYPTSQVRKALRSFIGKLAAGWEHESIPDKAVRTARALALIGDDEAVVDAVWAFGANILDRDIVNLMDDTPPMDATLLARLLAALVSESESERAKALAALRVSRRPGLLSSIIDVAAEPGATTTIRYHALRAARDLVQRGADVPKGVEKILGGDVDDVRHVLSELLMASATPRSTDLLAALARKLPLTGVRDEAIVAHLVDTSERGKDMARRLQTQLPPFPYSWAMGRGDNTWSLLFPAIADDEMRQKALDAALMEDHSIDSVDMIECVATFDIAAAFDLTSTALQTERRGRDILPRYLLRFDKTRAIDTLLDHLPDEADALVRWEICRVLRWADDETVSRKVREMAQEPSTSVREAAYDCAGWQLDVFSEDELRSAAQTDDSYSVRIAARDALWRQLRLRQAAELRERLVVSTGSEAWMYTEALVLHGDPHLLAKNGDPLCIWTALKTFPKALQHQAQRWLERQAAVIAREAGSEDFQRGRTD